MLAHKVLDICVHAFIRIQGEHVQHRLKHQIGQCYTLLPFRVCEAYVNRGAEPSHESPLCSCRMARFHQTSLAELSLLAHCPAWSAHLQD